jgi:two-component system response regulator AtoC
MAEGSVLIVEDDSAVATVLAALLTQAGMNATGVATAEAALKTLSRSPVDVVITDLNMPGMHGMDLLARIVHEWPEIPIIVLTGHGTVPIAVEAMRAGAADFLLKPFDRDQIIFVVRKALHSARHGSDRPPPARLGADTVLPESAAMREVFELLARAARSTATVLIRGESGTGKEVAARAIHDQSPRRDKAFVAINCAALPDSLLESELFGYEKGAFTGAGCRKPGRIELANGGTILLDEIGDVSLQSQVKLLRVIQTCEVERLGGTERIKVDVRWIAATHRDLDAMLQAQTFREDLYYRLSVIPVTLPPLRERAEDIAALVGHFVASFGAANGRAPLGIDPVAVRRLMAETWPGNVRQLQNFVERLVVLGDGPTITTADVERELARGFGHTANKSPGSQPMKLDERRRSTERQALCEALERSAGNRSRAARILGVSRRTLYNMLALHGLD